MGCSLLQSARRRAPFRSVRPQLTVSRVPESFGCLAAGWWGRRNRAVLAWITRQSRTMPPIAESRSKASPAVTANNPFIAAGRMPRGKEARDRCVPGFCCRVFGREKDRLRLDQQRYRPPSYPSYPSHTLQKPHPSLPPAACRSSPISRIAAQPQPCSSLPSSSLPPNQIHFFKAHCHCVYH
ncbi:hypothetical protein VTI74DRAFT_7085 [Chaetomium olivicolor]